MWNLPSAVFTLVNPRWRRPCICKSKMAAPMHLPGSEVAAFMNDARRLNIYCDGDRNALNDVILDYFTSGHASDSDDDTFHEEK